MGLSSIFVRKDKRPDIEALLASSMVAKLRETAEDLEFEAQPDFVDSDLEDLESVGNGATDESGGLGSGLEWSEKKQKPGLKAAAAKTYTLLGLNDIIRQTWEGYSDEMKAKFGTKEDSEE